MLRDIRAAAEQSAAVVLRAGGIVAPPDRVRLLVRLVSGLAFDQLTIPAEPLGASAASEVVDRLLTLVIGPDGLVPNQPWAAGGTRRAGRR